MGFNIEGCKRAVYNTNNSGVEAAVASLEMGKLVVFYNINAFEM
jgi:hypothetical protein